MSETLTISEEVKSAFNSVDLSNAYLEARFGKINEWKVLFKYYNDNNEKNLGMACKPCFAKVYYWIKIQLSK